MERKCSCKILPFLVLSEKYSCYGNVGLENVATLKKELFSKNIGDVKYCFSEKLALESNCFEKVPLLKKYLS